MSVIYHGYNLQNGQPLDEETLRHLIPSPNPRDWDRRKRGGKPTLRLTDREKGILYALLHQKQYLKILQNPWVVRCLMVYATFKQGRHYQNLRTFTLRKELGHCPMYDGDVTIAIGLHEAGALSIHIEEEAGETYEVDLGVDIDNNEFWTYVRWNGPWTLDQRDWMSSVFLGGSYNNLGELQPLMDPFRSKVFRDLPEDEALSYLSSRQNLDFGFLSTWTREREYVMDRLGLSRDLKPNLFHAAMVLFHSVALSTAPLYLGEAQGALTRILNLDQIRLILPASRGYVHTVMLAKSTKTFSTGSNIFSAFKTGLTGVRWDNENHCWLLCGPLADEEMARRYILAIDPAAVIKRSLV